MTYPQSITILGSTGSIGRQTLELVADHPENFRVYALVANSNIDVLHEQCGAFHPAYVYVEDKKAARELESRLSEDQLSTQVLNHSLNTLVTAEQVDVVVSAIVGTQGLKPTFAAAQAGKRILLANKESLVMAGKLLMNAALSHDAEIIPIDSEHNAIFQCLPHDYHPGVQPEYIRSLTLTASGGPFRTFSADQLQHVTPEQALKHPNWDMGAKVSIDSATMMNKGLEVIEAYWLFALPSDQIHALIHPQSIVHSFVEYIDGSVLAQMAPPDMRIPIAHALGWPKRLSLHLKPLTLAQQQLDFDTPDRQRFPCLQYAYECLKMDSSACAQLNAVNEVAVEAFLKQQLAFTDIARLIERALGQCRTFAVQTLEDVFEADTMARDLANRLIAVHY